MRIYLRPDIFRFKKSKDRYYKLYYLNTKPCDKHHILSHDTQFGIG